MYCPQCGKQNDASASYCISCGSPLPRVPQENVQLVPTTRGIPENLEELYKATIGPKNQAYYLHRFLRFDSQGKAGASWHWPAFFVPFFWFLYRKMWRNAALYFVYLFFINLFLETGTWFGTALYFIALVPPAIYANALYYRHCKRKIAELVLSTSDVQRQLGELSGKGGTSNAVLYFVLVPFVVISILAAISIPSYQNYITRAHLAEAATLGASAAESVASYYYQRHQVPKTLEEAGFSVPFPQSVKDVSVNAENGVVTVTMAGGSVRGKTLLVVPSLDKEGKIVWTCISQEIEDEYLPQQCQRRGNGERKSVASDTSLTPEQLFERTKASAVMVFSIGGNGAALSQGSGVVIGNGEVITNCHVVAKASAIVVQQALTKWNAQPLYTDFERDLCALKVPGLSAPPVNVGTSSQLRVGQRVYAIGAPQGLSLTLSEGLISSLRPYGDSYVIQTSAPVSAGSSGGGLFDEHGQLIGITTFVFSEGQNLNFAVPVDWIRDLPQREAKANEQGQRTLEYVERAIALTQQQEWANLVRLASKWSKEQPNSGLARSFLGFGYMNLSRYADSIKAFEAAIRLDPKIASAWRGLGLAYLGYDRPYSAVEAAKKSTEIQPNDAANWGVLGLTYLKTGKYDLAVEALEEAVRLNPIGASEWYSLGMAYSFLGQRSQVRRVYETLRRIDVDMAEEFRRNYLS